MPVARFSLAQQSWAHGLTNGGMAKRRADARAPRPIHRSVIVAVVLLVACHANGLCGKEPNRGSASPAAGGLFLTASGKQRAEAIAALPLKRLTPAAQNRILSIAKSPTLYRKLPTQAIQCERDMFVFLTRHPEILVGMWDLMGVTNVQVKRTGPYQLNAEDGAGTQCVVDLVYGDATTHIFVADGSYDGKLAAKPIRGSGVFVLRSSYAPASTGGTTVTGVLDCFVKFDSLGADLVARTLSGLIGRSADNNFIETARFIAQVNGASQNNPEGMIDLARRLPQVPLNQKRQFARAIVKVASQTAPGQTIQQAPLTQRSVPSVTPPNGTARVLRRSTQTR